MINERISATERSYGRSEGSNDGSVQEEDEDLLKESEVNIDSHRRLFPRQQEIIATESTVSFNDNLTKSQKQLWEG